MFERNVYNYITFQLFFRGTVVSFRESPSLGKDFVAISNSLTSLNKQLGNHLINPIEVSQSPRLFRKKTPEGERFGVFRFSEFLRIFGCFLLPEFLASWPKKTKTSGHFLEKPMFCIPKKKTSGEKNTNFHHLRLAFLVGLCCPSDFPQTPHLTMPKAWATLARMPTLSFLFGAQKAGWLALPGPDLSPSSKKMLGNVGIFPPILAPKNDLPKFLSWFCLRPLCRHVNFGGRQVFFNTFSVASGHLRNPWEDGEHLQSSFERTFKSLGKTSTPGQQKYAPQNQKYALPKTHPFFFPQRLTVGRWRFRFKMVPFQKTCWYSWGVP